MKSLATTSLALFTETNYMKRIHGGMLVKEIINTMLNKTNGSDMEMKLYSGHDLTIVSILNCLGLDVIKPEFGSSIIFELHKTDKHIVKVNVALIIYVNCLIKTLFYSLLGILSG